METEAITISKAFSDENRIKIFTILKTEGECCACDLLNKLSIHQPTLSHHMKILNDAKLITSYKRGKWMYYNVNKEYCGQAKKILLEIFEGC